MRYTFAKFCSVIIFIFPSLSFGIPQSFDVLTIYENPTPAANDQFGFDLGVVGNKVAINARKDDTAGTDSGSVYLFDIENGILLQTVTNPTPSFGDTFGRGISEYRGNVLIGDHGDDMGHQNSGSAYLVDSETGSILETYSNFSAGGRNFGWQVESVNDNLFISELRAGANVGAVHLFNGVTGALVRTFDNPTPASDDRFGWEIAVNDTYLFATAIHDSTLASRSGAVYMFEIATGNLVHTFLSPTPSSSDSLGYMLLVKNDKLFVSRTNDANFTFTNQGAVYVYDISTKNLEYIINNPNPSSLSSFGQSMAILNGDLLITAPSDSFDGAGVGIAYLFDGETYQLLHTIHSPFPENDINFGHVVKAHGNDILISAFSNNKDAVGNGIVYLLKGPVLNNPPTLSSIGDQTVQEGELLEFEITATDPDIADVLTFSANNLPPGATFDPITAIFSWMPTFFDEGSYESIEFSVSDNGTPMELDVELIKITVGNINRSPVFSFIGSKETLEDELLEFNVNAVDPDSDNFLYSVSDLPSGAEFDDLTGAFSWQPNRMQEGVYLVTFFATDNGSPNLTGQAEVLITVGNVPTAEEISDEIVNDILVLELKNNVENSYLANLKKVKKFIQNGKLTPATNQLNAFIKKVDQDIFQGLISSEDGDALIVEASTLISLIYAE